MPFLRRHLLCLALAVLVPGRVWAQTAEVVRSEKADERIPGLRVKSKKPKIVVEKGDPNTYSTFVKMEFETRGRSLLKDESPIIIAPGDESSEKQKLNLEVMITGRVTPVRIIALGSTGTIEEEKILVIFKGWKKPKRRRVVAAERPPPESAMPPPAPAPTPAPRIEKRPAREPKAAITTTESPPRTYRLVAETEFDTGSRNLVDNATGGTALLDMPFNFGLKVTATTQWKKNIEPTLYIDFMRYEHSQLSSGTVAPPSTLLVGFGAGLNFFPLDSRGFMVSTLIGFQQMDILRAGSLNTFTFDYLGLPRLMANLDVAIYDDKSSSVWLEGGVLVDLSSSAETYVYRNGYGFSGRLIGTRMINGVQLRGSLFYRQETSSTTISDFIQTDYGLAFGLGWSF